MVFENKNGYSYFRECYCYLVSINGVPCTCFGDETDANDVADIIRSRLNEFYLEDAVKVTPVKMFANW